MPKLTFDEITGFGADIGTRGKRISRGFTLEEIDTGIPAHEIAGYVQFYTSAQDVNGVGMTAMGSVHPDSRYSDALQTNIVIQGVMHNAVRGAVVYTADPGGFTPLTYIVTRTRQMMQHTETILPNGYIIKADHIPTEGNPLAGYVSDYVPMTFRRTSPVVIFEGLKVGDPDDSGSDYQGYVNQGVFRGYPQGHWFLDDFTTSYSRYSGYSQFRIAIQRNILNRSWASFGTLFNSLVGRYVEVNPAHVFAAVGEPYAYGPIGDTVGLGFVHVGGYPTVDFASIGVPTI